MGVIAAYRSTQTDLWYNAGGGKAMGQARIAATAAIVVTAVTSEVGVFGGSYLAKASASVTRAPLWPGLANTPSGSAFAVLMRIIPRFSGTPPTFDLLTMSACNPNPGGLIDLIVLATGAFRMRYADGDGNISPTSVSTAATYVSYVSGTALDIMYSWDGTVNAGSFKVSVNGVEIGTGNPPAAFFTGLQSLRAGIMSGVGAASSLANFDINEIVIFDNAQNHVYATRTDFWPISQFDGSANTDVGVSNVLSTASYVYQGVTKTGTVGASTNPGIGNVAAGISYLINGTNYTGTLIAPPNVVTNRWAPSDTQIAVYNLLAYDTTLAGLLGTTVGGAQKIFDHVPDNTAFPFVQIAIRPWVDRGNYTLNGLSGEIWVHTWYQAGSAVTGLGDKQVQAIQARIDTLLHNSYLAITGWRNLNLRRALVNIMDDPDNVTKHGIQQFKILLGG